jgi:hypothetical protein
LAITLDYGSFTKYHFAYKHNKVTHHIHIIVGYPRCILFPFSNSTIWTGTNTHLKCIRVSFTNFKYGLLPWILIVVFTIASNNRVHVCGDPLMELFLIG